jgi:hypothetical protein
MVSASTPPTPSAELAEARRQLDDEMALLH